MQTLLIQSRIDAIRNSIFTTLLAVAVASAIAVVLFATAASAEAPVEEITGVIVDEFTVQTDGYPSRVVTINGDDDNTYLVETVGGRTPEGDYLIASHAARLPLGYKVKIAVAPSPEARLADFAAGGYQGEPGEILYQVFGAEDGETVLHKVEGAADEQQVAKAELRDHYADFEVHWDTFPVPIYLNPANGPGTVSMQIDSIKKAIAMWNIVTCSDLRVRFAGTTTIPGNRTSDNGVNLVYWDADYFIKSGHPGRLGEAWRRYDPADWTFKDIEVVLNDAQTISSPPTFYTYDMVTLMAHEIGHGLGFHHVRDTSNFMNTYLSKNVALKQLGQLDLDAVNYLYPGTCNAAPNVTSAVDTKKLSCFGPNSSATDAEPIVVLPDPEDVGSGGSSAGESGDSPPWAWEESDPTSSDVIDVPIQNDATPASSDTVTATPSDATTTLSAGDSTEATATETNLTAPTGEALGGTAVAVSAITSEDSTPDFESWERLYRDESEWGQGFLDRTWADWFGFSAD